MKYKFPLIKACIVALKFVVPFAASTQAEVTVPQEVWIAVRTDGKPGTGTIIDPYDGSQFDAVLRLYYDSNTTKITFNVGAGSFHTSGPFAGWHFKDGWHVKGAGKMMTTIVQDFCDDGGGVFSTVNGGVGNQSVEDLTIDCGYFRYHNTIPAWVIATAGDTGNRMSNWTIYGANSTNTAVVSWATGTLYWTIVGTTVSVYKDSAGAQLVAQGNVSGGSATLAAQNSSGITGNVNVTGSGDDTDVANNTLLLRSHNFTGTTLAGPNSFIRDVRVINAGNDLSECFAAAIITYEPPWPDNAYIDSVEVSSCGPHVSALNISSFGAGTVVSPPPCGSPVYAHNGRITNCRVDGAGIATGPPCGFDSGLVAGCTFTNILMGINEDYFPSSNIQIINNTISGSKFDSQGIVLNNAVGVPLSQFVISDNTIAVRTPAVALAGTVTNSVISGNRIIDAGAGLRCFQFSGSGVNEIVVSNNVIDASLSLYNTATNVTFCLNRTPDCHPVPGVPDNCIPPGPNPPIVKPVVPCPGP